MKPNVIVRLLAASIGVLLLVAVAMAQDSKSDKKTTDNSKTSNTKQTDANSMTSGPPITQMSGVITGISRHEGTSLFEIKVKDSNGKSHQISVSPSAVIKQGDQKAMGSALVKGTNVDTEVYTTPSGSVTAKSITITTSK